MPVRCPICKALLTPQTSAHRPFCSARCKTIDLGNWLTEAYRVPIEDEDDLIAEAEREGLPPLSSRKPIGDA